MRPVAICALVFAAVASRASAETVTVVLDFQGPRSDGSVVELKSEFERIMKHSAIAFDWKTRAEAEETPSDDLIVVKFKGTCLLKPLPYLSDERGPLAFTYSIEGKVQPFSEVKCDQVAHVLRSVMTGADFAKADMLMGRALGRVVAHEVVHMLTRSRIHSREGITKTSLTGRQLIAPELELETGELERLRADQ